MLIVIGLVCVILGCLPHSFRLPLNPTCSGTRQASTWLEAQILSTAAACFFAAEPLEVLYWVFFCSGSLLVHFPSPNRLPSNLLAPPEEGCCVRTVSVVSGKGTKGSETIRENAAVTCTVVWDQILCYWFLSSFIQYGWKTYFVFPVLKTCWILFMASHVMYPGKCSTCTGEKCVLCSSCVGCCVLNLVSFYVDQVYFILWLVFLSITKSQILKSSILLLNCLYFSLLLCQFLPNTF